MLLAVITVVLLTSLLALRALARSAPAHAWTSASVDNAPASSAPRVARLARPARGVNRPVLLVNAHYYPDVAATANLVTQVAEHLVEAGYAVEVCTGQASYVSGRTDQPRRELRNGVFIKRVWNTALGRSRFRRRIVDYATFHVYALRRIVLSRRYRGVIVLTTPPFLGVIGWIGRHLRGQRYAVWSMDLHPEAEIAAGMLRRESLPGRVLFALSGRAYRAADFVIALGPYMRARILEHGPAPERVATVPVWIDRDELPIPAPSEALAAELGLTGKFVVAYMGNAGIVHEFGAVLDAMRQLRDHRSVHFLFTGSGAQRTAIEAYAAEHDIQNFSYHAYFPREQLADVYALVDVHLVTLGAPFVGIAVPYKSYVAMATGRPVLFVGPERCETADAVRDLQVGAVVDPLTPGASDAIVAQLGAWSADPAIPRGLGARARRAVLRHYERRDQCAAIEGLIRQHWGAPTRADVGSPRFTAPSLASRIGRPAARTLQLQRR